LGRDAEAEQTLLSAQPLLAEEGPLHEDNIYLYNALTIVDQHLGQLDDAEKWGQKTLAAQIAARGPNDPRVWQTTMIMANVYRERGDYRRSRTLLEEALRLVEKLYGHDTHQLAYVWADLCHLDGVEGVRLAEGAELCNKAIAAGLDPPASAWLANIRRKQGHIDAAEKLLRRDIEMKTKEAHGPDWWTVLWLALTLQARGDFAGAEATLARLLAQLTKEDNPRKAVRVWLAQADLLRARGRCPEATAAYEKVLPALTKLQRPEEDVGRELAGVGKCAVDESRFAAALAPLARALAIFDAREVPPRERGEARFALARAQAATGAAALARANATHAVDELAASDEAAAAALLPKVRAWLLRH
jgi:tetratricopeptide (TPR) repeat protein